MARVLSILPGNNAIVSTENLFRIVIGEGKRRRTHGELVEMDEAAETVKQLRRCSVAADAVPYPSLAVPERDDA